MLHTREEVIERVTREFETLDRLVSGLSDEDWQRSLARPETKDPWTIKDALAHITHWKANTIRAIRKHPRPAEERSLQLNDLNHLVYMRWHDRPPQDVLAWHRQTQEDLLTALHEAPDAWFSGKEHAEPWPYDIDGHSREHRVKDIEKAVRRVAG